LPWFLLSLDKAIRTGRKRWVLACVGLASYTLLTNMYSTFDLVLFAVPFLLIRGMLVPVEEPSLRNEIGRRTRKIIGASFIGIAALVFWWYLPAVLPYGVSGYLYGG
ncbi:MAG: hypothetical protein NWE79_03925, partial [Candidatus Bathyarchaeota archaeon]|nr:hypothetical protein [Candidatus Bathyarchaeota archaeon]